MIIIAILLFMILPGVWSEGAIGLLSLFRWLFVAGVVLAAVTAAGLAPYRVNGALVS